MEQVKVSVIIPVYNTQEYVRLAVESILQQTLRELEVIVIDDGSTDGSLEILRELARQDERMQLYEQQNQGQSVARNKGMDHATGEFLYFMDSDDLLELDALRQCYQLADDWKLKFVCFDAIIINEMGEVPYGFEYNRRLLRDDDRLYSGYALVEKMLENYRYTPSPCLTLYLREFVVEKKLRFYPGIIHEDELFNAQFYLQANRGMYMQKNFFKRRVRPNSTMTTPFSWRNVEGYLTVVNELQLLSPKLYVWVRPIVETMLKQMLDAVVWKAHVLPLWQRLKLLHICLHKYPGYVRYRTMGVLMFKRPEPS